jgi:hypothetical protein
VLGAGDVVTIEKLVIGSLPSAFHTSHTRAKGEGLGHRLEWWALSSSTFCQSYQPVAGIRQRRFLAGLRYVGAVWTRSSRANHLMVTRVALMIR